MKKDTVVDNLITIIIILIMFFSAILYKNVNELLNPTEQESTITNTKEEKLEANGLGNYIKKEDITELKDSNISYNLQVFNKDFYPYYQMLNEKEANLYNQLYANIIAYSTTFIPKTSVTINETKNAVEAIYNDHPEFFWLDSTYAYKYTESGVVVQIILNFNETINTIRSSTMIFDQKINEILNVASRLSTDYEKEKYIHDYLINNIEYDTTSTNNQSAFSALVSGKTVCAGYARAFQLLMIKLGIPTYYVTGYSNNEAHAWNIILLEDGFYNIDLTWDDSVNSYYFFNSTDTIFSNTHKRSSLSVNLPPCNAIKYATYNYYPKKNNYTFDTKDENYNSSAYGLE